MVLQERCALQQEDVTAFVAGQALPPYLVPGTPSHQLAEEVQAYLVQNSQVCFDGWLITQEAANVVYKHVHADVNRLTNPSCCHKHQLRICFSEARLSGIQSLTWVKTTD